MPTQTGGRLWYIPYLSWNIYIRCRWCRHLLSTSLIKSAVILSGTLFHLTFGHRLLSTDGTGDYMEWVRSNPSGLISLAKYGTLFDVRRSAPYGPPEVSLADETRTVPPQPQPVSIGPASVLTSWWGTITSNTMTGEQIDTLCEFRSSQMQLHLNCIIKLLTSDFRCVSSGWT